MSVIEAKIEQELVKQAKAAGFLTYKLDKIPGNRHQPDQLLINKDRVATFVEVKRMGLEPRPAQTVIHDQLREHGQEVYVIDHISMIPWLLDASL